MPNQKTVFRGILLYLSGFLLMSVCCRVAGSTDLINIGKVMPISTYLNISGLMFVSSSNVGIGTNSPGAKLDVEGNLILQYGTAINEFSTDATLAGNSDLAVPTEKAVKTYVDAHAGSGLTGTGSANYITKWTGTTSVGNSVIYESGGNIGIGTTGPSQKLHVEGNANINGIVYLDNLVVNDGSGSGGISPAGGITSIFNKDFYQDFLQFYPPNTAEYKSGGVWYSTTVPTSLFRGGRGGSATLTNGWEAYRVSWTSFPYRYLETLFTYFSTTGHTMTIMVETSPDGTTWTTQFTTPSVSGWPGTYSYKKVFNTAGKPYFRITFTPTWNVAYPSNDIYLYNVRFFGGYSPYGQNYLYGWDENRKITLYNNLILNGHWLSGDGENEGVFVASDGDVGIGTTSPSAKLAINGGLHVGGDSDPGDNNLLVDGDLTVSGGDISIGSNNGGVNFNDASAYWMRTATNWGIYWDTSANAIEFHGAGTDRANIDLDTGDAQFDGDLTVTGGDVKDSGGSNRITFSGTNVIITVG